MRALALFLVICLTMSGSGATLHRFQQRVHHYINATLSHRLHKLPILYRLLKRPANDVMALLPVIQLPLVRTRHNATVVPLKLFGVTRLPPLLEYILQRIQKYFSVYAHEDLSRPPPYDSPNFQPASSADHEPPERNNTNVIVTINGQNNLTVISNNDLILSDIKNSSAALGNTTLTLLLDDQQHAPANNSVLVINGTTNSLPAPDTLYELPQEPLNNHLSHPNSLHATNLTHIFFLGNGKLNEKYISIISKYA